MIRMKFLMPVLIVAIGALCPLNSNAQVTPLMLDTAHSGAIEINYRMNFESNSLSNAFAYKVYQGSYLEKSELEDVFFSLPVSNSAGFLTQFRSRVYIPRTGQMAKDDGFFIGLHDLSLVEMEFNRNLFGLIFMGNKRYAGSELKMSNQGFRQQSYQSLNAGYYTRWVNDSSALAIGISASFLKGQNFHDIDIRRADIYTSTLGDEVAISMDYRYTRSDTQYTRYFDMNGYGAGLGFFLIYTDRSGIRLSAEVMDLGAIRWVNNRYNYHKDSSMVYRGWEIDNLFNIDGKVFEDATLDSLNSIATAATNTKNRWVASPSLVQVELSLPLSIPWLRMNIHAEHLLFSKRLPLLSGGPEFVFFDGRWTIMPYLSTGGYNTNSIGFRTDLLLAGRWACGLASNNLDGFLYPKTRQGMSASFTASYKFNPKTAQ